MGGPREPPPATLEAFVAGCAAYLDFAVRPDWQRIAVVDAPAVLGAAEWHARWAFSCQEAARRSRRLPPATGG